MVFCEEHPTLVTEPPKVLADGISGGITIPFFLISYVLVNVPLPG